MDGENVTDLSATLDSREDTAAYEISLFKMADLQAGDEVSVDVAEDGRLIATKADSPYSRAMDAGRRAAQRYAKALAILAR